MALASMFPGGASQGIKLDAVTNFTSASKNQEIWLNWTDPDNKYLDPDGTELATWDHTRIIRKAGSQPVSPYDGVLVVESAVKNQYQTEAYVDSGLENGITYHYAAYAFTTDGLMSDGVFTSGTPKTYVPIFENNTWKDINQACSEGVAASIWSKGDTKPIELTNGKSLTLELLSFSNPGYSMADGSGKSWLTLGLEELYYGVSAYGGYVLVNATALPYGYFDATNCTLKKTIDAVYSLLPDDLKPYVRQTKHTYDVGSGVLVGDIEKYGTGPCFLFPLEYSNVSRFFSTAARRKKKLDNGDGDYSDWWLGDSNYKDSNRCAASRVTSEGALEEGAGVNANTASYNDYGVYFAFCFGPEAAA